MKLNKKGVAGFAVVGIIAVSLLAVATIKKGAESTVKSVVSVVR